MRTDRAHTKARITQITAERVRAALDAGEIAVVAGFQGAQRRRRDHHARPRRLRPHRRGAGRRAQGRRLRDLHRRGRRLHRRSEHRPRRAQAARGSPTTRCSRWRASGAKVLQARSVEFAKKYGVPVHVRSTLQAGPGHARDQGGERHGRGGRHRRHARPQPGEDLDPARARPAGHRRPGLRRGRRQEHRRGHDRPEHQPRRLHRHLLHPAPRRLRAGGHRAGGDRPRDRRRRASSTTSGWPRSRSSASACAATPGWPRPMFAALVRGRTSTSR